MGKSRLGAKTNIKLKNDGKSGNKSGGNKDQEEKQTKDAAAAKKKKDQKVEEDGKKLKSEQDNQPKAPTPGQDDKKPEDEKPEDAAPQAKGNDKSPELTGDGEEEKKKEQQAEEKPPMGDPLREFIRDGLLKNWQGPLSQRGKDDKPEKDSDKPEASPAAEQPKGESGEKQPEAPAAKGGENKQEGQKAAPQEGKKQDAKNEEPQGTKGLTDTSNLSMDKDTKSKSEHDQKNKDTMMKAQTGGGNQSENYKKFSQGNVDSRREGLTTDAIQGNPQKVVQKGGRIPGLDKVTDKGTSQLGENTGLNKPLTKDALSNSSKEGAKADSSKDGPKADDSKQDMKGDQKQGNWQKASPSEGTKKNQDVKMGGNKAKSQDGGDQKNTQAKTNQPMQKPKGATDGGSKGPQQDQTKSAGMKMGGGGMGGGGK